MASDLAVLILIPAASHSAASRSKRRGEESSRRLREFLSRQGTQVNCDPSGFKVHVDVKLFSPEDLLVKVSGDFVEVQGKHEEKKKDGSGTMTRQFSRRYRIQGGVDTMVLESAVSPEGILIIFAPMLRWSL
ncbi:unnamed protein product [Arctogadus glacialis]